MLKVELVIDSVRSPLVYQVDNITLLNRDAELDYCFIDVAKGEKRLYVPRDCFLAMLVEDE